MTVAVPSAAPADQPAAPAPVVPTMPQPPVRFIGDTGAYWRLLFRGAALLAVTLGIYRFWFATDVRRYLWFNTEIAGETLEYTGTAYELLIGFLIAIALLVPIYVGLAIAALGLGPVGQSASTLSFPLLFFLGQFAIYRARRYRLTRTIYRGVRCHQDGSAVRYAICAVFWWILIVLTLGLAYPFAQSRLERYKLRHTYYGNLVGRFEGSGIGLFLRGLPMWLLAVGPLVFAVVYAIDNVDWQKVVTAAKNATSASDFTNQLEGASPAFYSAVAIAVTAAVVSVAMAAILLPVFQAMMLRWWLSGLRFGELSVRSHLRTGQIYAAYLRFLWYGLLFATAVAIVGALVYLIVGVGLAIVHGETAAKAINALIGLGIYVATMLGYSAIYQGTVKLALWRAVESVEIKGLAVLDRVTAEGAPSSAVGEGLADALNVGGI
jgi:uncharacterized membrane protein YjgN (DUF898 family)